MAYTREEILKIESEKVVDPRSKKNKIVGQPYNWQNATNEKVVMD